MFPLLRHIGHTPRYAIPERSTALRARNDADPIALQGLLAAAWRHVHAFWKALKLCRFSLLLAGVCVAMLLSGQAQDAVRALGEEPSLSAVLSVMAAGVWAAVMAR